MSSQILDHPMIGPIKGLKISDSVTQYRGTQYATLKDRFSRSELQDEYECGRDGFIDATRYGPLPLVPFDACEIEQKVLQKSLPFSPLERSDTLCLTLNIATPNVTGAKRLPVLVFVHGGGFTSGSGSFPQNDLSRLTAIGLNMGMPIVSVAINYRVGAPGFLSTPLMTSAGYATNNGLRDQRVGLKWVQQNIGGFGGDPNKVTFLGESAGATSGFYQLHNPEPLFHQFIGMSGSSLLRPRPGRAVEQSFTLIAEILGAEEKEPEKMLQTLLDAPGEVFADKVGRKFTLGPTVDRDVIPELTTYEMLGSKERVANLFPGLRKCGRVILGDCQLDGMIWAIRLADRRDVWSNALGRCLHKVLDPIDPALAPAIIEAYSLDTSATSNSPKSMMPVLQLGNDLTFALPARLFARAWSLLDLDVHLYHFNGPNPWEGPWNGQANHCQDLVLVLQNYEEYLPPGQRQMGIKFAKHIITFVNGGTPFPNAVSGAMVYYAPKEGGKDESKFLFNANAEQTERRDVLLKIVKEPLLDRVTDAWLMFMAGG